MKYGLIVLSLAIIIFMASDFNSRLTDLNRLKTEREFVTTRLEGLKETKSVLENKIAYANSDTAVLKWAYENHLVIPGDLRVVPVSIHLDKPIPPTRPIAATTIESNLEQWLSLFVDPFTSNPSP
jgi:hypothetical protein